MIVDSPLYFHTFSTVYTTRIHTLGVCSIATLEFCWNFSGILHILAHVAWIVDISMDILHISHGLMEISLISLGW